MAKTTMKRRIAEAQNGTCALSGEALPADTSLIDTDRIVPKAEGGIYTDENTRIVDPVAHMERHGNLRLRTEDLEYLKALIDDREQMLKLRLKIENQLRAAKRKTDRLYEGTVTDLDDELNRVDAFEGTRVKRIEVWMKSHRDLAIVAAMRGVLGVGPMTIAYCLAYLDPAKAAGPSAFWAYTGLDKSSHERYTKGEKSGGNKRMRTALYRMADSMCKNRECAYREVYDRQKMRRAVSENIVTSRNTEGKLVEVAWKDAKPSHRHGDALRAIMKHFLADLWFVWREIEGLPTRSLYVEEKLGHTGIVNPKERGWQW